MTAGVTPAPEPWLALVIGNTRLHWAAFYGDELRETWHTCHLTAAQAAALIPNLGDRQPWLPLGARPCQDYPPQPPLYLASVVPDQAVLWQTYPHLHSITLDALPLQNLYPTLGIDRALNLLGAGDRYGWPVLVVDGGTALTFTAGDDQTLIGGQSYRALPYSFGRWVVRLPPCLRCKRSPQRPKISPAGPPIPLMPFAVACCGGSGRQCWMRSWLGGKTIPRGKW